MGNKYVLNEKFSLEKECHRRRTINDNDGFAKEIVSFKLSRGQCPKESITNLKLINCTWVESTFNALFKSHCSSFRKCKELIMFQKHFLLVFTHSRPQCAIISKQTFRGFTYLPQASPRNLWREKIA